MSGRSAFQFFLLLESWIKDGIQLFRRCLDVSSYGVKRLMNLS